jgi:riboflavin kinase/FMN adenylyltransferase
LHNGCSSGCVAAIGNFDGMHKGHQAILAQLKQEASHLKLPSTVVLFEPQPSEFFDSTDAPARLMNLHEKLAFLATQSIDTVLCIRFNESMANCEAAAFIQTVLCETLEAKTVLTGADFCFGQGRKGNVALLQTVGSEKNFDVKVLPDYVDEKGERISSTRIRHLLQKGDLPGASVLLSRDYTLSGRVIEGHQRGRSINVPTANISLKRPRSPILGVYAVEVLGLEKPFKGVANVGNRPTVDGTRCLLEVHLFDFNRDIYHQHLNVRFLKKLRDEKRFDSFDALTTQIWQDIESARAFFKD